MHSYLFWVLWHLLPLQQSIALIFWNQETPEARQGQRPSIDELTTTPPKTLVMDVWMTGAPGNATSGGLWINFKTSTDKLSYVSAARALTNGSEGVTGPWDAAAGGITNEPNGVGTLQIVVGQTGGGGAAPDGDGDIIVARVTLEYTVSGTASITARTIPGFTTWSPPANGWDDGSIPSTTLNINACIVNEDCDDGAYCNGTETCTDGACVPGTNPCPDDGLWCNGDDGCDEITDQCIPGTPRCQDDGLFCNGDESCDEDNDQCLQSNLPCPDDGDPCTDDCDEPTDTCYVCNATGTDDPCCLDSPACETAEACLVEFNDFYVDGTNGDNTNDGLTPGTAWKTITHALNPGADAYYPRR